MTKLKNKTKVAIVGLGYVGLPLAVLCVEKKYEVIALDVNESKINLINMGEPPFKDKELQEEMKKFSVMATSDMSKLEQADIILVCVPTPIDHLHKPDLSSIKAACESIQCNMRKGQLIIIESTINPGVCEEIVQPILDKSGFRIGEDYDLCHCPERINPGDSKWRLRNISRVVGASSENGLKKAVDFYESILEAEVTPMKSIKEAEATKIIENTFRDINIAYVNELAMSFDKMGIDLLEVIKGASTKPFAYMPHFPGCGIGGHCIPVDPYYLIERAKQSGFDHNFLRLARKINNGMPKYTVDCLVKELNKLGKSVKGTKIGVLGLAYKANVDDTRESPVYKIIEHLQELEAELEIFDPFVLQESTVKTFPEMLQKVEVLLFATPHNQFLEMDLKELKNNDIILIVDGRNFLNKDEIVKLKINYKGIGR